MEKHENISSIKNTLIRIFFIPVIFLIIFILLLTINSINQQIDAIRHSQQQKNLYLKKSGNTFLSDTEYRISFSSQLLSILPHSEWEEHLAEIRNSNPIFQNIYILDSSKKIIASDTTTGTLEKEGFVGDDSLRDLKVYKGIYFTEPYISPTMERSFIRGISTFHSGKDKYYLVTELCLKDIQKSILANLSNENNLSFILDHNGNLIAHPDEVRIRQLPDFNNLDIVNLVKEDKPVTQIFKAEISSSKGKEKWYIGSAQSMEMDWVLVTMENLSSAGRKLFFLIFLTLLSVLVFTLIFFIVQLKGLKKISSSISRLIEISSLIASGQNNQISDFDSGFEEIETLKESLVHMADSIRDRDLILEQRVEERTETLRILHALNQKMIDAKGITELILSILTEIPALRTEAALFGRSSEISKELSIELRYLWYNGNRQDLEKHPSILLSKQDIEENSFLQGNEPKFIKHIDISQEVSSHLKDFFHNARLSHLFIIPLEGNEMGKAFLIFTGNGLLEFSYNEISLIKSIQKNLSIIIENRTLLQRLQYRAEELAQARNKEIKLREEAEQASNSKSLFLANMSHELRTPLNSILGFSQILRRAENIKKDQKDNLDIILKSGEHLLSLINSILEISRIEAQKLSLEKSIINLDQFLNDIVKLFTPRMNKKRLQLNVNFSPDLPEYIITDAIKLRQILFNIIDNSIKYTEEGSVSLSADIKKRNKKRVHLSFNITDTGSGISPQNQESIFKIFEQTNQTSTVGGVGLGLTITKQYVKLLGGEITVSSKEGEGSAFNFIINVDLPDKNEILKEKKNEGIIIGLKPNQPIYRILIAGEENDNIKLLYQTVKSVGLETYLVLEQENIIKSIEELNPSLIWLNYSNEFDGYSIGKLIRKHSSEESLKIILYLKKEFLKEDNSEFDSIVFLPLSQDEILEKMSFSLGIQYNYSSNHEQERNLLANSDIKIPEKGLDDFVKALRKGDLELIQKQMSTLKGIPKSSRNKLQEMIDEFRFHDIIDLITRND